MKVFYITFITALLGCVQCFCIGFGVKNSTSRTLKVVSEDGSIRFTDGTLAPKAHRLFEAGYRTCRVIFSDKSPDSKKIMVQDKETSEPLFGIMISFVEGSPNLEIVDIADESIKRRLYIPSIGGGYNFVLAIGDTDLSVNVESVQPLQPCGIMQPYIPQK